MAHRKTETFRANLKTICAEYGKVKELALAAGITREYLSMIIHGKVSPGLDVALQLADAAGIPLGDLCERRVPKAKRAAAIA